MAIGYRLSAIPEDESALTPGDLDSAIEQVIRQREYSWRLPRQPRDSQSKDLDPTAGVFRAIGEFLASVGREIGRWFRMIRNWFNLGWPPARSRGGPAYDWLSGPRALLLLLGTILAGLLIFLLFRTWQRHRILNTLDSASAGPRTPDLHDEHLSADELPEESWMRLARELVDNRDLRLALRAFYLASLARLAQGNLISLAKFKSNRDYLRELDRRAHALPELARLFGENVAVFERTWYGLHIVTREILDRFVLNLEQMQRGAETLPLQ